jgi:hypothetical protein
MVPKPTPATTRPDTPLAQKHSPPESDQMDKPAGTSKKAVAQTTVTMVDHQSGGWMGGLDTLLDVWMSGWMD